MFFVQMIKKSAVHPEMRLEKTQRVITEDLKLSTASLWLQALNIEVLYFFFICEAKYPVFQVKREMQQLEGRILGEIKLTYSTDTVACRNGKWEARGNFRIPATVGRYALVVVGNVDLNMVW